MRSLWRAFHSYEALPKSNIVPNQRTFPLPVLSLFSGHVPALKSPTPAQQFAHDATLHLLAWPKQYPLTKAS